MNRHSLIRGVCLGAAFALAAAAGCGGSNGTAPADGAAVSADGAPRAPDASRNAPDAIPGAPDAVPGAPDAVPGAPDAAPGAPDAAPDASLPPPPPPPDASPGPDAAPPDCPLGPVEVVIYGERDWAPLADALASDASPCANYYISMIAPSGDKTYPRGGAALTRMHSLGPRIHAMAEFSFSAWSKVVANTGITWAQAGVEFRQRMAAAGYDIAAGDMWEINELPSGVRTNTTVRHNVRALVKALHDGPAGSPPVKGTVFTIGIGQGLQNFSVYKPNIENWLQASTFWNTMKNNVRFWAQEVYTDPDYVCVGSANTGTRSQHINAFTEHIPELAGVSPVSAVSAARSFFNVAYVPLMNAAWQASQGYGDVSITLAQMENHVSTQVYAARAWTGKVNYLDGRLGFGWSPHNPNGDPNFATEVNTLATRLARAIHYAYNDGGGGAKYACSPSGAFTWCQCVVSGASFNNGWSTFTSW